MIAILRKALRFALFWWLLAEGRSDGRPRTVYYLRLDA